MGRLEMVVICGAGCLQCVPFGGENTCGNFKVGAALINLSRAFE